ncbi:MAG: LytTR family DNA-binding domain-containing protein [Lachnospiraceae bacterium]|nr:LytTR family DNA-binding domain-containing protein [Lachnospiraceae bacterium]
MIPIYLCDDSSDWLSLMKQYINKFIVIEEVDMEIVYSSTEPQVFLSFLHSHPSQNSIYFLDVNLKANIDGLLLATEIRRIDPRGFIIFVTVHSEMMSKTFSHKIEALNYIIKDEQNLNGQVHSCLKHIWDLYNKGHETAFKSISVNSYGTTSFMKVDDIILVEKIKNNRKIRFHLRNEVYESADSLSEIHAKLGNGFFRINRVCLINLTKIKLIDFDKREVKLENGRSYHCSVRMLSELRKLRKTMENS